MLPFQPDDVVNVATDKINGLLESFMGINDTELGEYIYVVKSLHYLVALSKTIVILGHVVILAGMPILTSTFCI